MALAAAPAKPEEPGARAQAALRRIAELPAEQQRAWLRHIEGRLLWANRLTMKPEEADKEQARVADMLRQKSISWQTLVELLRQLDQREKAAIGRLVRQYRSQVYDTFQRQQRTLVERQEAWYRVWSLWEAAGGPSEQQDRLLDWLEAAIRSSTPASIGPLPPDPKFSETLDISSAIATARPIEPAPAETKSRPPAPAGTAKPALPGPGEPAKTAEPSAPDYAAKRPEPAPLPVRVPDTVISAHAAHPREGLAAPHRAESPSQDTWAGGALPAVVIPQPRSTEPQALPELPLSARPPERPSRTVALPGMATLETPEISVASGATATGVLAGTRPLPVDGRQPPELPAPPASGEETPKRPDPSPSPPPVAVEPKSAGEPADAVPPGEAGKRPPLAPSHDVTAMLPRTMAEALLPRETPESRPAVTTERPAETSAPKPAAGAEDEHVQVNVEELAARIAGVNLSLRTLEAELDEKRPWSADQLDGILNRLDILVLRQKDLGLFRNLVTPDQQAKVGKIDPPRVAIAALAARIADTRNRLRGLEPGDRGGDHEAAMKHLDELSDRLAAMATEK